MSVPRYNIELRPIRDDRAGYNYLCKLSNAIISNPQNYYVFDFSKCSVISHNGLAFIGAIGNYLNHYNKRSKDNLFFGLKYALYPQSYIGFNIDGMRAPLMKKLKDNGFWNHLEPEYGFSGIAEDYIGYREHQTVLEDSEIINHLRYSWLTNEKILMSEELKSEIISSIYEIFVNAYGHGLKDNPKGLSVISCGHYDSKKKELALSVLDFGGGIVKSVQKHKENLNNKESFKWALETGNSTRTDSSPDLPRGLGFGILKDFVHINCGKLTVCSGDFMATVDSDGEYVISDMPDHLAGTLVSITVNCDDNYYKFVTEEVESLPTYF